MVVHIEHQGGQQPIIVVREEPIPKPQVVTPINAPKK